MCFKEKFKFIYIIIIIQFIQPFLSSDIYPFTAASYYTDILRRPKVFISIKQDGDELFGKLDFESKNWIYEKIQYNLTSKERLVVVENTKRLQVHLKAIQEVVRRKFKNDSFVAVNVQAMNIKSQVKASVIKNSLITIEGKSGEF